MTTTGKERSLRDAAARRWDERKNFADKRSWLWSTYDRLLTRRSQLLARIPDVPLPLRGRPVKVRPIGGGDVYLRLGTTDFYVLEEVFFDRSYDAIFRRDLGPIKTIVDLGANIGLSVRLWQMHWPDARIIAVEPDPANAALCARNISLLGKNGNVSLVRACIAGRARLVTLDRSAGECGVQMRDASPSDEDAVSALTLPELLERCQVREEIDLLKCDIEGAERELFEHSASWLHRVRNLVVELHAPYGHDEFIENIRDSGVNFADETLAAVPGSYEHILLRRG